MPAHQTRIAVLIVAYVLGCGAALLALGVSGAVQTTALVPTAVELADMEGPLPVELMVDSAAALAAPAAPLVDGWAQIGSDAVAFTREVAPGLDFERGLRAEIALLAAEFALVEEVVVAAKQDDDDHDHGHDHERGHDGPRFESASEVEDVPPVAVADAEPPAEPVARIAAVVVATPAERGAVALASMPVTPAELGYTITFQGPRPDFKGLTYPYERHIDVFVDPSWTDHELAHVVAHEIGHAIDVERNELADHERWRAARGISSQIDWWANAYASDFDTPGGDFAECFAAWVVGTPATATTPFGSCAGTADLMQQLVHG